MDRERLPTVGETLPPDDEPTPSRPSWLLTSGLIVGIVVVMVLVSRPTAAPPDSTLVPPTLPDLPSTTTTLAPLARAAFGEASALTWSPVSGLASVVEVNSVVRHEDTWYLLGQDQEGPRVARSADGISWEYVDTPTDPGGSPSQVSGLTAVGPRLVAVGKIASGRGEVAALWWATGAWDEDAPAWELETLPIDSFADTPDDAMSFLEVLGPVPVERGVLVVVHEVVTNIPTATSELVSSAPNLDLLPMAWREAVAGGASVGSTSTEVSLSVGGFTTDTLTWAEVGLTPYQRSRTITWVASAGEVPIQVVQDPAARISPGGVVDEDTIFGIQNGNAIVTSETGVTWRREATLGGLRSTDELGWTGEAWVRILDDAILRSEDATTWNQVTPPNYLGTEPWYLSQLATSDIGIAALAHRPRAVFPPPIKATGVNKEKVTIDFLMGELSVEPADGLVIIRDLGEYLFGRGGTRLDGDEVVLTDTDSGGELARIPLARWINAWNQEPALPPTETAVVHSVDGTTWSARTVSEIAGTLAEGASSIHLTDEFALLSVYGNGAVPPVWVGSPRP